MKKTQDILISIVIIIFASILGVIINSHTDTEISTETHIHTDSKVYLEATIGDAISITLTQTVDDTKDNIILEEDKQTNILYETTEEITTEHDYIETSTQTSADTSNMTYLGTYSITAYCPCEYCCGKTDGITASGTQATAGRTVGCNSLPFGTVISINGQQYVVEDRGGMSSNVIDIFFNTHQEALNFGRQTADVYIVN